MEQEYLRYYQKYQETGGMNALRNIGTSFKAAATGSTFLTQFNNNMKTAIEKYDLNKQWLSDHNKPLAELESERKEIENKIKELNTKKKEETAILGELKTLQSRAATIYADKKSETLFLKTNMDKIDNIIGPLPKTASAATAAPSTSAPST